MKYLLSLMLVTAMTCKCIDDGLLGNCIIQRCENNEVVCYIFRDHYKGGISCKFKEQQDD